MIVFNVKYYIVLAISWDIAFPAVYYFELPDSQKKKTYNIVDFKNKNVRVVIIDIEIIVGIKHLKSQSEDNDTDVTVSVIHYDGTMIKEHMCSNDGQFSSCNKVGRFIKVTNKGGRMPFIEPTYSSMYMNNFVGCFKAQENKLTMENTAKTTDIEKCRTFCIGDKNRGFYGMNDDGECACARFLSLFELVDLNLCKSVANDFEMHGGNGVFSVYSAVPANMSSGIISPSPECIFDPEKCPKCPEGRKGVSCEIIDCSVNNGGCGDRKCQNFDPKEEMWEFFHAGFCECEHGYQAGLPFCDAPFDECANGSDLCDKSTTECVDKILLYTCECKLFHTELDQHKCKPDMVLIAIVCAATLSILFCLMYICCPKKRKIPQD